ncbi:ABC transporter permease [Lolliginicoccus levis]|uniref:ABC transporter permease n=1 Tax=Lolliginicoccus levis TaxID=2919542 RepID=UPI00241FE950|nr:ABC transporter permease [Lolliginicoccus levis]
MSGGRSGSSGGSAVFLVALREFRAQVRTKSFVVGNIITLVIIVGGLVAFSIFRGDGEPEPTVVAVAPGMSVESEAVEGAGEALGVLVEARDAASVEEARSWVDEEDAGVALLGRDGTVLSAYSVEPLEPPMVAVLESAAGALAMDAALESQGVDASEFAADAAAGVDVEVADPPDSDATQQTIIAGVVLYLLTGLVFGFGMYVAMGVVEEKSSRVVEILLSTIKPLQLLWGKVLGIGAAGLLQVLTYAAVGLVVASLTGLLSVSGGEIATFASLVVWAILGYLFFALLYAAAGSLVSRQEEVQSVQAPVIMVMFACLGASVVNLSNPGGTLAVVTAWLPPFSAFAMPIRVATGEASAIEIAGSLVLMVLACAGISLLAARIYSNSVLRMGARIPWREALRR